MLRPKSLQQRLAIFVLLPVALLLIVMGFVGFIYARSSLLAQWKEAAILRLQRAAHGVDMRLGHTKKWIRVLDEAGESKDPDLVYEWVAAQLEKVEGVSRVNLTWIDEKTEAMDALNHSSPMDQMRARMGRMSGGRGQMGRMADQMRKRHQIMMRRFHRARLREITPPRYDSLIEHKTVSLISDLTDKSGQSIGRFEAILRFDYLIENIIEAGWWHSNKAFLVDNNGKILSGTVPEERKVLADNNDPVERQTLNALKAEPYGTIRGQGHPPAEVSGFYKLQEAPWSLVMIAPGKAILAPIVRFRFYYFAIGAGFIFLIVVLIKTVTGGTVTTIKDLSQAAKRIAGGDFDQPLPVKTQDEVGELTRSFNMMMAQLEDRMRIKQALDLAMEVQQNLLPLETPQIPGFDIAARSIYCDETGGDFYDFLETRRQNSGSIGIAVGDVSGHGISAALLMATIRAFVKSNVTQPGSISERISSVNRLLTRDTRDSGQFVTLFYAEISPDEKTLRWVRAGHDPAILYTPHLDKFEELQGDGIALGVDPNGKYLENIIDGLSKGQIFVIGTDGVWEARNIEGEMFGRERLMNLIRQHSASSSDAILNDIIDSLKSFQDSAKQEDDVTLLVIKVVE